METKTIDRLYNRITSAVLFSPERHHTKQAVETVLTKIGGKLDRTDFNALENLEFCAPNDKPLFTVLKSENPVVYLSPGIEQIDNLQAENWTARAFAEGIAMAKGTIKSKIAHEVDTMLATWNYPAAERTATA